ncbi:MAG: exodeoxyribonuclease VII large subunit [Saccharofermentans sp.]|nr:exodeoxyribonuclease VII large subunit [Saccharofermentans sp.]
MYSFTSVSSLNTYAGQVLSSDERLSSLEVTGEISGFKVYSSGHAYFTLKDSTSEISCVMFASRMASVSFKPKDGDKVTLTGSCTIYPERGKYQIVCSTMKHAGKGDLKEQLKLLFDKLSKEGLFDPAHKKRIPMRPSRIGIISSPTGAVIHDILVKLNERNPYFDAVLYPAAVQGENCPSEVIKGVDYFNNKNNVDVIIIARGGGSIEDLWGFNSEELVRKVYDSDIPVISAIGHETDITLLDHVADKRSPTPTAAAEDVLKTYEELSNTNLILRDKIISNMKALIAGKRNMLDALRSNKALYEPEYTVRNKRIELTMITDTLNRKQNEIMDREKQRLKSFIDSLALLGPHNVLMRGYSYVSSPDGSPVVSVKDIKSGGQIDIHFKDGTAGAVIKSIKEETGNG